MVENWPISQCTQKIVLIEVVVGSNHEFKLVTYFLWCNLRNENVIEWKNGRKQLVKTHKNRHLSPILLQLGPQNSQPYENHRVSSLIIEGKNLIEIEIRSNGKKVEILDKWSKICLFHSIPPKSCSLRGQLDQITNVSQLHIFFIEMEI